MSSIKKLEAEAAARHALEEGYTCAEKYEMGACNVKQPSPQPTDAWSTARGNIETVGGHRYHFMDPDPDVVTLEDIAHALSNICRFGGHTRHFYSVAEHSVLVSNIVEAKQGDAAHLHLPPKNLYPTLALLHDAHEAYVWDAPSPLKPLLGDKFKELADIADRVIWRKFMGATGGSWADFKAPIIKDADKLALVVEGRALLTVGPNDKEWRPLPAGVHWAGGLDPREAKALFLERAKELGL